MHSLTRETHQSHGFHGQTHQDRGLFVVSGGQDLVVVMTADFVVSSKNFVEVTVNQVCTTASKPHTRVFFRVFSRVSRVSSMKNSIVLSRVFS